MHILLRCCTNNDNILLLHSSPLYALLRYIPDFLSAVMSALFGVAGRNDAEEEEDEEDEEEEEEAIDTTTLDTFSDYFFGSF